jgi:hypothetical protein
MRIIGLLFGMCSMMYAVAQPLFGIIELSNDATISRAMVMQSYSQLPRMIQVAITFYRVDRYKIYFMSACLICLKIVDMHEQNAYS